MAQYNRFEVYLPVRYTVTETDVSTGRQRKRAVETNPATIAKFKREAVALFGGATHAHPMGHSPFLGMWSNEQGQIDVDDVTYLFVLVPAERFQEAIDFFDQWRLRFIEELNQDAVLITHWPVQIIGDIE